MNFIVKMKNIQTFAIQTNVHRFEVELDIEMRTDKLYQLNTSPCFVFCLFFLLIQFESSDFQADDLKLSSSASLLDSTVPHESLTKLKMKQHYLRLKVKTSCFYYYKTRHCSLSFILDIKTYTLYRKSDNILS